MTLDHRKYICACA